MLCRLALTVLKTLFPLRHFRRQHASGAPLLALTFDREHVHGSEPPSDLQPFMSLPSWVTLPVCPSPHDSMLRTSHTVRMLMVVAHPQLLPTKPSILTLDIALPHNDLENILHEQPLTVNGKIDIVCIEPTGEKIQQTQPCSRLYQSGPRNEIRRRQSRERAHDGCCQRSA